MIRQEFILNVLNAATKLKVLCLQSENTFAWVKCPFQLLWHGNQRIFSFYSPKLLSNNIKFGGLNFFSCILSSFSPVSSWHTQLFLLCFLPSFQFTPGSLLFPTAVSASHRTEGSAPHPFSLFPSAFFAYFVQFDAASLCHGTAHVFVLC